MASPIINNGENEGIPSIHGNVHNMVERLSNVQVHSFGFDGVFRVDRKGSTMNHYTFIHICNITQLSQKYIF